MPYSLSPLARHLPTLSNTLGWQPLPLSLSVRRAKRAVYLQQAIGAKADLTIAGPAMEVDGERYDNTITDMLGLQAYKVQPWPTDGFPPEMARLASLYLEPGRPWVQVVVDALAPGTFHRFKVTPFNECGEGETSEQGPVATMLPSVPEPVELVEARTMGPNSAVVCWLPPHHNGSPLLNYVLQMQKWERRNGGTAESEEDEAPLPWEDQPHWENVDALVTPEIGPLVFMQLPVSTQISVRDSLSMLLEQAHKRNRALEAQLDALLSEAAGKTAVSNAMSDSDNDPSPRLDEKSAGVQHAVTVAGVKVLAFIVRRILPGYSYSFRVAAFNGEGQSSDGFPAMMKRLRKRPGGIVTSVQ